MKKTFSVCIPAVLGLFLLASSVFADSYEDRYERACTFAAAVFTNTVLTGDSSGPNPTRDADIQSCISAGYEGSEILNPGESPQRATGVVVTDIEGDTYYLDVMTITLGGEYSQSTERLAVEFDSDDLISRAYRNAGEQGNTDFMVGKWEDSYSQRAWMLVSKYSPDGQYFCEIHWGSSAWETTLWRFHTAAAEASVYVFSDCEKVLQTALDDGSLEETVQYTGGTGSLMQTGEGMTWNDDREDAGNGCVFIKM